MRRLLVLLGAAIGSAACASEPELVPAPAAAEVPGPGHGAAAIREGVRIEARADAWSGNPEALEEEVTPLLVTVRNNGSVPLRLRFDAFELVGQDGRTYAAIPPLRVDGSVVELQQPYPYFVDRFEVAPYLSPFYPGVSPVDGPFDYDPAYYDRYYPDLARVQLPTADMMRRALPEGVVMPGGSVQGFVYFQDVTDAAERVQLRVDLVNASAGVVMSTVTIPFLVDG